MKDSASKGHCICIHCNERIEHLRGKPCKEELCPNCGKKMMRENSYHHQLYKEKLSKK
jgi:predicted RNA-binding Zn-ribbon protein involved in translation (DUF1610 family)